MANILIVDDSPTDLYIYQNALKGAGFHTISANSGEDGIKKAKDQRPDLIIMDVVMGGMNGFQATRKLSQDPETAEIPVLIISTKDQYSDQVWGKKQGARDYLVKPVNEEELLKKINTYLN